MNIVLIPHVVLEKNDDIGQLNQLYEKYMDSNRIIMIEDHNAIELKV